MKQRALVFALLVSLVVNGILLGIFVGQRAADRERHAMHAMTRQILQSEPEAIAEPVAAAMRAHRSEMRSAFKELRRARRDVVELLKEQPLDADKLRSSFTRVRAADEALKAVTHEILVEVLPGVEPDQRMRLLMQQVLKHRHAGKLRDGESKRPQLPSPSADTPAPADGEPAAPSQE